MAIATRTAALILATCAACAHGDGAARQEPSSSELRPQPDRDPAPAEQAPPAGPPAVDAAHVAAVRADVDRLLAAQAQLLWQGWTTGIAADLAAAMAGRDALLSPEALRAVRDARERATGDDRRALSLLHAFLVGEHLARAAPAATAAAWLSWDGGRVPSWSVTGLLASERDPARRVTLEHGWAEAERRREPAVARRWNAIAEASRRLGYEALPSLASELRGAPGDALEGLAGAVLDGTDPVYGPLMDALARQELGTRFREVRGCDLPRLLRGGEDTGAVPAERVVAAAHGALARVGLDLGAMPGVVLDAVARPGKDVRALTLPVEVPGSVRVAYAPRPGTSALRGLLHELGAAAFYAHVRTTVPEFRRLGTVTAETWAALFEDLAGEPEWLVEVAGVAAHQLDAVVRAAAARRLHGARVLAGRILVEAERAREAGPRPAELRAIVERTLARPVGRDELDLFLLERDPLLESADALRAVLLASHASAFLTARAPPAWWRSAQTGAWLAAAFADGSRLSPQELARTFGRDAVDATALAAATRARASATGLRLLEAGSAAAVP